MKKLINPYFEPDKTNQPLQSVKKLSIQNFATASAFGCGRNPIDMKKLQQTGQTSALISLGSYTDLR